jgi:hypothetical protein
MATRCWIPIPNIFENLGNVEPSIYFRVHDYDIRSLCQLWSSIITLTLRANKILSFACFHLTGEFLHLCLTGSSKKECQRIIITDSRMEKFNIHLCNTGLFSLPHFGSRVIVLMVTYRLIL